LVWKLGNKGFSFHSLSTQQHNNTNRKDDSLGFKKTFLF